MSRFGDVLAELREDRGLTQKQLAEIFHISNSSISSFETGYRTPSIDLLMDIAGYFGVTTDYLLGLSKSRLSPDVYDERLVPDMTVEKVINMIRSLPMPKRSAYLDILKDSCFVEDFAKKALGTGEK